MLFRCEASADRKTVQLDIFDNIGEGLFYSGVSARYVRAFLSEHKNAETIEVNINSKGGSVTEGFAIHEALVKHPARIVTRVSGVAASMASIVAMAGDEIVMGRNAFLMVHNPRTQGVGSGQAHELRSAAETLDQMRGQLAATYAERSGRSKEEVMGWMDAETWFSATRAKKLGLADRIDDTKPRGAQGADASAFVAQLDEAWVNAPAAVIEMLGKCATVEPMPSSDPNEPEIEIVATEDETDGMKEILAQLAAIGERLTKIEAAAPAAQVVAPPVAETADADLAFDLQRCSAFEGFVSDGKVPNTAEARARFMTQAKDAKALEQITSFYASAKPVVSTAAHSFAPVAELEPGTMPKLGAQALKICRDMNWKPEELYKD